MSSLPIAPPQHPHLVRHHKYPTVIRDSEGSVGSFALRFDFYCWSEALFHRHFALEQIAMSAQTPPNGASAMSRENYRHSMEEWRQQALAQRNQYQPRVQNQIQRQFHEYSPPVYASVIGFRRDRNLLVATSRVSGFASTLGRDLDDQETKAITEYTLDNIHNNAALKWFTLGLAAYLTYRGRRTWQFPFYKPKMNSRFNPNEATSLFSKKKIHGRYPRFTWHTLRFTAYAAVTMLMVEPLFRAANFIRTEAAMTQDSRLKQFTKDASQRVEQVMANPPASRVPFTGNNAHRDEDGDSWASNEDNSRSADSYQQASSPPSWSDSQPSASSTQSQQSDHDWDVLDDEDDASPIASSARKQPASLAGSAWDRVRQQSQGRQQQQPDHESRGWASQSQTESQPQSGWGNNSAGSPNDGFSFSRSDEERSLAKEQAQQDFDKLIERERKGVDQERSWRNK
ncbi:hypothetical protein FZEAL_4887 [Fusarium zealandicum]|uniref:Endo-1,3(4)-beta-glucanase n=1 Tax=Fusarium zealandicum TaxID=1053134 RepID=A0A8H4XKD3_9HYPO|nr:hypothetical protein FZEAL_4887 [Fusarium zealandicum]